MDMGCDDAEIGEGRGRRCSLDKSQLPFVVERRTLQENLNLR